MHFSYIFARGTYMKKHKNRSLNIWVSYSHYLPGIGGMFALAALFLLGALLGNALTAGLGYVFGNSFITKYGILISYPVMFIPPLLFASTMSRLEEHRTPEVPLDKGGFGCKGWMRLIFIGVCATIAGAYLVEPVITLLPPMPADLEAAMKQLLEGMPLWATLLSVSVFAPLFEEWLCRCLVLRGLLHSKGPLVAITVSAAFFAVIHLNPWQAIPAFALGLLFGYAYYRTGSLKLTMLMHCINNTMAVILSKIPTFKEAETFMDVLSPWAYWSIWAACIVILACSVILLRWNINHCNTDN